MKHEIKGHTKTKYVIAHNGKDVFHFTKVEVGQEMGTGQPYVEVFDTEKEAGERLNELSGEKRYPFDLEKGVIP